jgi:hypothetical protein
MSESTTAVEDQEETETEQEEVQEESESTEGEESLGDAGKKALDAMKAQRNAERLKAREAKTELDRLKAELALKDKPADEQAIEAAKAEARAEAKAASDKRILKSELKALSTGKLADPTDAALYINLDDFTVDEDGEVDSDALNEAIADLIARKPHLGVAKQNRFDGDADQGAKGKNSKPSQLTRADVERMKAAGQNDAIVQAKADGRLNDLLGIKN